MVLTCRGDHNLRVCAANLGWEMKASNKARLAVGSFIVGSVILMTILHIADRYGAPHDVLAMIAIGWAFVGGLSSTGYVASLI